MHIYTTRILKILDIKAPIHIATTQCLQYKYIHSTNFQLDIKAPIHIITTQCLQYKYIHSTNFQHIYISMRSNNKVIANQNNPN
jgi:hypothetical protein